MVTNWLHFPVPCLVIISSKHVVRSRRCNHVGGGPTVGTSGTDASVGTGWDGLANSKEHGCSARSCSHEQIDLCGNRPGYAGNPILTFDLSNAADKKEPSKKDRVKDLMIQTHKGDNSPLIKVDRELKADQPASEEVQNTSRPWLK